MRDWKLIRQDLEGVQYRSKLACQRLAAIVGTDHGSDRVSWNEAVREVLRADVEAVAVSLGCRAAVAAALELNPTVLYALDPVVVLQRITRDVADAKARAAVERYTKSGAPGPDVDLESIVPDDRVWIGDGESVDTAADYEEIVADLLSLAKIKAKTIECRERGGVRTLTITIGRDKFQAELRGDTDYIDEPPLIECLNSIVAGAKKARRYYQLADERWGQETGFAYATGPEAKQLRAAGLLAESDDEE